MLVALVPLVQTSTLCHLRCALSMRMTGARNGEDLLSSRTGGLGPLFHKLLLRETSATEKC